MQELINKDTRRTVLSLLAQDTDYTLSDSLLLLAFDEMSKRITADQLDNQIEWLVAQGFVTVKSGLGFKSVTLTDYGLDIATAKGRAVGIRDLRPSELEQLRLG